MQKRLKITWSISAQSCSSRCAGKGSIGEDLIVEGIHEVQPDMVDNPKTYSASKFWCFWTKVQSAYALGRIDRIIAIRYGEDESLAWALNRRLFFI